MDPATFRGPWWGTSAVRPSGALWILGVLNVLLGALLYPLFDLAGLPALAMAVVLALPVVFFVYSMAGLIAWWRRPRNRVGVLLVWAGLTMWVIAMGNTTVPAFRALNPMFALLPMAAVTHLLLAFPSGRLGSAGDRALVLCMYVGTVVLQVPSYLFDPHTDPSFLSVADLPALRSLGTRVQTIVVDALLVGVAIVLLLRLARARPEHRRRLGALYGFGVFIVLFVPASAWMVRVWWPGQGLVLSAVQIMSLAVLPVVVLVVFLLGGFRRSVELDELGTVLGGSHPTRLSIRDSLAAALGDPSLLVVYWSVELQDWVDEDGLTVADPGGRSGRARSDVELDGAPVAAIEYDAAVLRDPNEVERVGSLIALALERERLSAELRASRQAVVESRERLVGAADVERRRISRGLHDGLQARLLLMGIDAQRIAIAPTAEVAARATALRDDADQAAAELRALIQDLVPPALIELGVAGAVEELVESMPIPTRFEVAVPERIGHSAEMTAYFVVAEALSNVVKHSRATACTVTLRTDDTVLHVSVSDNGNGLLNPDGGTGLAGIADRVAASGGTSEVTALPEGGTSLCAQIPHG